MHRYRVLHALCLCLIVLSYACAFSESSISTRNSQTVRLKKSYRFERDHWIYVHLEGTPRQIGFQHGWLLAPEIADALAAVKLEETHDTQRNWGFFRKTAQQVLWPHIETEYREELRGIAAGASAHGAKLDLWDIVALNAKEEVPDYYVPWLDKQEKRADAPRLRAPGNCSAFVATGAWTKDHQPVIAHNSWTTYMIGERWRIVFDIVPVHGQRILMDGFPGAIASGDDYGINASRLAVTETTITGYASYDPQGAPEFVRARKALQYATSIDEFVAIFLVRNNGGYANDWLLADYKTGEIARFEVGLKLHRVWRGKDGYFAGANYPSDPEFIKAETDFNPTDDASSPNARRKRWDAWMAQNKGQIDVGAAQAALADHWDSFEAKESANERSLCGHVHASPRGVPEWEWVPYTPGGAVSAKAADSALVKSFAFLARAGLPCGQDFLAGKFLDARPEFSWQRPALRDMKGNPWAVFKIGDISSSHVLSRPQLGQ
jgi:hypothetical protein